MSLFVVKGNKKLGGEISVHGAKNSALPILAASVAVGEECVIKNCPQLSDIRATCEILKSLGCLVSVEGSTVVVNSQGITADEIPDYLMRELRSSFIFMGALLTKTGRASMCAPGGCEIGLRPVDIHLSALKQMGVCVTEESGRIICEAPDGLKAEEIILPFPSVGATENLILASLRADGTTYIKNAAAEPEIKDLSDFLNVCGADIKGAGTSTIVINGRKKLHGAEFTVMPDRIVAVSYLAAAAITGSELIVKNARSEHIGTVLSSFRQAGCSLITKENEIQIKSPDSLKPMETIRTMPYPGFPTDCQALIMSVASVASGTTIINENIFESRFRHVGELNRMGADITVVGRSAIINGVSSLYGSCVRATDLRGGMALVLAALCAEGESIIENAEYIDRGYEKTERDLSLIGADIRRYPNGRVDTGRVSKNAT